MFKIPASYYLKQALKSDTIEGMVENYSYFVKQMVTHGFWVNKKYADKWVEFYKRASVV